MRGAGIGWLAVGLALGLGSSGDGASLARAATSSEVFTPIVGSVLGGETAAVRGSDGRYYVVYELLLTNAKRVPAELQRIEVTNQDTGAVVRTLEGETLVAALHDLNVDRVPDAALASSESRLVLITLDFGSADDAPARLTHRLLALAASSPGAREPTPVQYDFAPLDVSRRTPPVLRSPLRGPGWLAINGCCEGTGAHRGAIQTVNGKLWDAQRFAIDWMRVDDAGRLFEGSRFELEDYAGYGAPVYAAADGRVVRVFDGLDDQTPGTLPDPTTITLATVDGNHVVLDHGGGVYTFYAHFQKGSVQVGLGDRVKAGQQLALLGNTGNTSAPHMHFQVMTGPVPLGSDGIPFVNESFTTLQTVDDEELDAALFDGAPLPTPSGAPQSRTEELPLDLTLNVFP